MVEPSELLGRLSDHEDGFTERKLEGVGASELKKTIVAFSNSLPPNRTAILYIGVSDNGDIRGVENPDKLQRTLRNLAENDCYPPIWVDTYPLSTESKTVLAIVVPYSTKKPHFAGPAFIRRGSESINATEEVYRELLLSQDDKRRYLLDNINETWTILALEKKIGEERPKIHDKRYYEEEDARIFEVASHFVRLQLPSSGRYVTERLNSIDVTYDDKKHRPMIVVRNRA